MMLELRMRELEYCICQINTHRPSYLKFLHDLTSHIPRAHDFGNAYILEIIQLGISHTYQ
jgi:hypothetical protein